MLGLSFAFSQHITLSILVFCIVLALYPKICYVFSLCDNFDIIYKKAITMQFWFDCQVVDSAVVHIKEF